MTGNVKVTMKKKMGICIWVGCMILIVAALCLCLMAVGRDSVYIDGTFVQHSGDIGAESGGDGLCHSLSAAAPSGACLAVVQDAVRLPDLLFRGGICDHDIQQRCKRAGCIQENI